MSKWRDTRAEIESFLDNNLERELKKDQKKCRILSEFDLQACVNYRLRRYFKKIKIVDWYILNQHTIGKKKPDIVIARKKKAGKVLPMFIIELKEHYQSSSNRIKKMDRNDKDIKKDILKLIEFIRKSKTSAGRNRVKKTYVIYAISESVKDDPKKLKKELKNIIQKSIRTKRKKTKMSSSGWIEPIVINAFYDKEARLHPDLKLIHSLKKAQLDNS